MGHLYKLRVGWEGERLAHYLLSRFSFVAQPTTIADDVGSDFYCTIFDILGSDPVTVEPRTSFAIQVKSNSNKIEAHNKVHYLHRLEIPFFIGVVDQTAGELKIYSAERYPMMTSIFGLRKKLWLRPVEEDDAKSCFDGQTEADGVTLDCYHLVTFSVAESRTEIRHKVERLLTVCQRAMANIGSRRAEEHIYQWDDAATVYTIVAGVGSIQYFRDNIYKRLAEAFYNFEFLLNQQPEHFDLAEFEVYERFHLALVGSYPRPILTLADNMYRRIKALLAERAIGDSPQRTPPEKPQAPNEEPPETTPPVTDPPPDPKTDRNSHG
jgi:hypothetical protein